MVGAAVLWSLAITLAVDPDPSELVRRLASPHFAEREAATVALETLGETALPALLPAVNVDDLELSTRATALVARIRSAAMLRPTSVRLSFEDQPLLAVVEAMNARVPDRVAWHPTTPTSWKTRRLTIREPDLVPFWTAIDLLCKAGDLHYLPGSPGGPGDGIPQFRLFLAPGLSPCPRADDGPFRIELIEIEHSRRIQLAPYLEYPEFGGMGRRILLERAAEKDARCTITLRLVAEPRLLIERAGDIRITEAVDDRGRSLLEGDGPLIHRGGTRYLPATACYPLQVVLPRPVGAGKVLRRLRLTLPIEVVSRRPDPRVIPLGNVAGKVFRHGSTTIRVLGVGKDPQGHTSVELALKTDAWSTEPLVVGDPRVPVASRPATPVVTPNAIEVIDQEGRVFPWFGGATPQDGPAVTAKLTLWPEGGIPVPEASGRAIVPPEARQTAIPTEVHHYEFDHAAASATFEFRDLPLP